MNCVEYSRIVYDNKWADCDKIEFGELIESNTVNGITHKLYKHPVFSDIFYLVVLNDNDLYGVWKIRSEKKLKFKNLCMLVKKTIDRVSVKHATKWHELKQMSKLELKDMMIKCKKLDKDCDIGEVEKEYNRDMIYWSKIIS